MDYLVGNLSYLYKGYGKQLIETLTTEITKNKNLPLEIIVQPDNKNTASCNVLIFSSIAISNITGVFSTPRKKVIHDFAFSYLVALDVENT